MQKKNFTASLQEALSAHILKLKIIEFFKTNNHGDIDNMIEDFNCMLYKAMLEIIHLFV